ncbi:hypothetical protein ACWFOS_08675 [Gordonia terrae]
MGRWSSSSLPHSGAAGALGLPGAGRTCSIHTAATATRAAVRGR